MRPRPPSSSNAPPRAPSQRALLGPVAASSPEVSVAGAALGAAGFGAAAEAPRPGAGAAGFAAGFGAGLRRRGGVVFAPGRPRWERPVRRRVLVGGRGGGACRRRGGGRSGRDGDRTPGRRGPGRERRRRPAGAWCRRVGVVGQLHPVADRRRVAHARRRNGQRVARRGVVGGGDVAVLGRLARAAPVGEVADERDRRCHGRARSGSGRRPCRRRCCRPATTRRCWGWPSGGRWPGSGDSCVLNVRTMPWAPESTVVDTMSVAGDWQLVVRLAVDHVADRVGERRRSGGDRRRWRRRSPPRPAALRPSSPGRQPSSSGPSSAYGTPSPEPSRVRKRVHEHATRGQLGRISTPAGGIPPKCPFSAVYVQKTSLSDMMRPVKDGV